MLKKLNLKFTENKLIHWPHKNNWDSKFEQLRHQTWIIETPNLNCYGNKICLIKPEKPEEFPFTKFFDKIFKIISGKSDSSYFIKKNSFRITLDDFFKTKNIEKNLFKVYKNPTDQGPSTRNYLFTV